MHPNFYRLIMISLLFFCSCKQGDKKETAIADPVKTTKETRISDKYFKAIVERSRPLIPKAFHFAVNDKEQYFTVTIDHYHVCTLDNLMGTDRKKDGVIITDYNLKEDNISEITYTIRYSFKPSLSTYDEQISYAWNDSVDASIRKLATKYPHSHLWEHSMDYTPANKEESIEKKAYDKDFDSLVKTYIPPCNYKTQRDCSVFISDNLPKNKLDCDTKTALAFATMKKNLEDMLTAGDGSKY